MLKPPEQHAEEQDFSLLTTLACSIKKTLVPSRKEDSAVRIRLPFDKADFQLLIEKGKPLGNSRYGIQAYSDLNELLGDKWYLRINNINGDFACVIVETICFYLIHQKPILDFDAENTDNGLKLNPTYIEQGYSLAFNFVRSDGNIRKLNNFL